MIKEQKASELESVKEAFGSEEDDDDDKSVSGDSQPDKDEDSDEIQCSGIIPSMHMSSHFIRNNSSHIGTVNYGENDKIHIKRPLNDDPNDDEGE